MKVKYREKHCRSVSGKILIATLALVLIIGCAVGGTAAWLSSKSDSVVTTFTYGDINITLTEAKPEKKPAKIIPGVDLEKDLTVTVKANSEDCWLFVKVEKSGTFVENKVTYSVDDGWTQGDGKAIPKNVYYRTVDTATTDTDLNVLEGNCITVSDKLTKEDIKNITTQPKLTFTAYAVQKDGIDTAADAWTQVSAAAAKS